MRDVLLRILALARKELFAVLTDPRARITLFGPPILQSIVFGYAASYDLTNVPYAVVDQDRSAVSRELTARLDGSGIFHRVADLATPSDIAAYLNERRVLVVLQIQQNFERRLEAGQTVTVSVLADGRNSNTAGSATAYVATVIDGFNADWRAAHGLAGPPVHLVTRAWYNPNLETRWEMIPALIAVLSLLQTLLLTAMSVAREREQGTFDQLLVTPIGPVEIMIGKAAPSILIGAVQATLIFLVAELWFRIPFAGSIATLAFGLLAFLLASVGIGLLLSAVVATMQQAMLFAFMGVMPFVLLSGFATPLSAMPQWLHDATVINPLRFGVAIARRVYLEGADLRAIAPDMWPLGVIAAVSLTAAAWLFQRRA
jgi:pyoluteorin transport system permease protein